MHISKSNVKTTAGKRDLNCYLVLHSLPLMRTMAEFQRGCIELPMQFLIWSTKNFSVNLNVRSQCSKISSLLKRWELSDLRLIWGSGEKRNAPVMKDKDGNLGVVPQIPMKPSVRG